MEFTALALENRSVHFSASAASTRFLDKSMYPNLNIAKKVFDNL